MNKSDIKQIIREEISKVINDVYFPYQINDKRGRELYTKAAIALDDDVWVEKFNPSILDFSNKFLFYIAFCVFFFTFLCRTSPFQMFFF